MGLKYVAMGKKFTIYNMLMTLFYFFLPQLKHLLTLRKC